MSLSLQPAANVLLFQLLASQGFDFLQVAVSEKGRVSLEVTSPEQALHLGSAADLAWCRAKLKVSHLRLTELPSCMHMCTAAGACYALQEDTHTCCCQASYGLLWHRRHDLSMSLSPSLHMSTFDRSLFRRSSTCSSSEELINQAAATACLT